MNNAVVYNRQWLEESIRKLQMEQEQLKELNEIIGVLQTKVQISEQFILIDILADIEKLNHSIFTMQKALKQFMNDAAYVDEWALKNYTEVLEKTLHIFV